LVAVLHLNGWFMMIVRMYGKILKYSLFTG